jgi:hypothetical protein
MKQPSSSRWMDNFGEVQRPNVGAVNNHISESEMDGHKVDQILNNGDN